MANWRASRPVGAHDYWIKMLVPMEERIAFHLQSFITIGEVLDWMATGRIVLLLKENGKRNKVSN